MPKVKKKYAGGNPILFARFALFVNNIRNDTALKGIYTNIIKTKPQLIQDLKENLKQGNITGIKNILENNEETKQVLTNPNIEKIFKLVDKIPLNTINTFISKIPFLNSDKSQDNQEFINTIKDNQEIINTKKDNLVNNTKKDTPEFINTIQSNQGSQNNQSNQGSQNNQSNQGSQNNQNNQSNQGSQNNQNNQYGNNTEKRQENNENNSLYIKIAIFLKAISKAIFYVVSIFLEYIIYKPLSSFLPALLKLLLHLILDLWQFFVILIILVIIILIVIYFLSGGSKRKPNNSFDNLLGGFSTNFIPTIPNYKNDDMDDLIGDNESFITEFINNIGDVFNGNVFKNILRLFISNPGIDNINDDDKQQRIEKKEGRCDNINKIESKDGRYCYEQLTKKHIEWDDKEIKYKLLENKDIKKNHLDYYIPNCKGSNIFTKEYIASCKDSRRTKFICKI